jgi:RNA polymerase sigma-70 factor (ECF subfamily)
MASPDACGEAERRQVLLAASGDRAAFAGLVRRHQTYVIGLIARACGDRVAAEDLAQQAFLRAWRRLPGLRDAAAFRPWLRRIAFNIVVDAARAGRFAVTGSDAPLEDTIRRSDDGVAGETSLICRMDLERALGRLSFPQRACVVLAYGEGMSHSEIGAALAMPAGTVKSHIARALAKLRGDLAGPEDGDVPA